jgi:hypothetical protein
MITKLSLLKDAASTGNWKKAVSIAAKFPVLGDERNEILDAQLAYTNPRFCVQIGKNPEDLIARGIEALRSKYKLEF